VKIAYSASVCLAASVAAASAQSLGGAYRVSGKNFDGSSYSGTAEIVLTSNTTCRINWVTGGTTSTGICMRNGSTFAAGYRLGNSIGLVIYQLNADGTLDGLWTIADKSGVGSETLTPRR
jgi:hypothetical protein